MQMICSPERTDNCNYMHHEMVVPYTCVNMRCSVYIHQGLKLPMTAASPPTVVSAHGSLQGALRLITT